MEARRWLAATPFGCVAASELVGGTRRRARAPGRGDLTKPGARAGCLGRGRGAWLARWRRRRTDAVGRAQGGREEGDEVWGSFINRENCRGSDVN